MILSDCSSKGYRFPSPGISTVSPSPPGVELLFVDLQYIKDVFDFSGNLWDLANLCLLGQEYPFFPGVGSIQSRWVHYRGGDGRS